ncbi:MAG TPA: hypothetical protein VMP01_06780 [Pirellulaceae bacterium]|nr:hypothetical protein [Pirellulaceae bacterium]
MTLLASDAFAELRGALLTAEMVTTERLSSLRADGYGAVILVVSKGDGAENNAARAIEESGLELHYWIEVGRSPELADEHPLWMASLQGHDKWRRLYKDFPQPKSDETIKVYPWVPVFYREAFDAHLARIEKLLAGLPPAKAIYLNDLQGAPSACGCGNPVCRWTTDYGPIVTATKLGDDAAAKFVAEVRKRVPKETKVVPVWVTECEAHDKDNDKLCAGVGCYEGICWKAYVRQLTPLAADSDTLGALLLYKEFGQDVPNYKARAGWIGHAIEHGFADQPAKQKSPAIKPSRIVAVLQGWDVTDAEIAAQLEQATGAGAGGTIVAFARIDQAWSPKTVTHKPEAQAKESSTAEPTLPHR